MRGLYDQRPRGSRRLGRSVNWVISPRAVGVGAFAEIAANLDGRKARAAEHHILGVVGGERHAVRAANRSHVPIAEVKRKQALRILEHVLERRCPGDVPARNARDVLERACALEHALEGRDVRGRPAGEAVELLDGARVLEHRRQVRQRGRLPVDGAREPVRPAAEHGAAFEHARHALHILRVEAGTVEAQKRRVALEPVRQIDGGKLTRRGHVLDAGGVVAHDGLPGQRSPGFVAVGHAARRGLVDALVDRACRPVDYGVGTQLERLILGLARILVPDPPRIGVAREAPAQARVVPRVGQRAREALRRRGGARAVGVAPIVQPHQVVGRVEPDLVAIAVGIQPHAVGLSQARQAVAQAGAHVIRPVGQDDVVVQGERAQRIHVAQHVVDLDLAVHHLDTGHAPVGEIEARERHAAALRGRAVRCSCRAALARVGCEQLAEILDAGGCPIRNARQRRETRVIERVVQARERCIRRPGDAEVRDARQPRVALHHARHAHGFAQV